MNKVKLTFTQILLMFGLIPLFTSCILLSSIAFFTLSSKLEEETYNKLKISATTLAEHYSTTRIDVENKDYTFVDELTGQNIEQTIFLDDIRVLTSVKDVDGVRLEGTKSDATIYKKVISGETYSAEGVVINGNEYYVYYVPLTDSDGKIIGMAFAGEKMHFVEEAQRSLIQTILIAAISAFVLFTVLIVIVSRIVIKPLRGARDAIGRMADGDIGTVQRIHSIAKETVDIINSVIILNENLNSIVGSIKNTNDILDEDIKHVDNETDNVASSSEQISTTVHELAESSQSMAMNIQDISVAVTTVDSEILTMRKNTETLRKNAETVGTGTEEAMKILSDVVTGSKISYDATIDITNQSELMSKTVDGIRSVLEMIKSVADQTKLLSLNASIEAARAGEAGRGFAVVASEIQKLSEQSNEGVEQIGSLATEMLKQASLSLELSKDVKDKMTTQQDMLNNMDTIFNELNTLIQNVMSDVNRVDESVQQVNTSKDVIVESVQELSAISEENAASSEEVAASMETVAVSMQDIAEQVTDITKLNDSLREAISKFK